MRLTALGPIVLAGIVVAMALSSVQSRASGVAPVRTASSVVSIPVGPGYTDVTPRQVVRTSDDRLWVATWDFDIYPQGTSNGLGQKLRMYMAMETGIPSGFLEVDASNGPADVNSWSVAVGASDVIHVVWTERTSWDVPAGSYGTDQRLRYSLFDTSTLRWGTIEEVDSALDIQEVGQGDELCAIAVDGDGSPHVVYLKSDGTRRRVAHRQRTGPGTWTDPTIVPEGYVDDQPFAVNQKNWHPGIAFDQAGRSVVTWMRGGWDGEVDGRPFVRVFDAAWGKTQDISGMDVWNGIDTGTPLYVDDANTFHVTFLDAAKHIRYYYSTDLGVSWTANHPGSGTTIGDNPTPGPGPNGTVRIYAHGPEDVPSIAYWEGEGESLPWGTRLQYASAPTVGAGYDGSVNVRWSRYFWHYPERLDIAYWKSDYPSNALFIGSNSGPDLPDSD